MKKWCDVIACACVWGQQGKFWLKEWYKQKNRNDLHGREGSLVYLKCRVSWS